MKGKKVLIGILAAFLLVSLSVFFIASGKEEGTTDDKAGERVEVTVYGWLPSYAKPFSEVFKAKVEAKHPDIELVFIESTYEETGTQYLLFAESGKDVPDVCYVELIMSNELSKIGALEDLRDWISADIINDLAPAARDAVTFEGKITSIIWDISPYCLFASKTLANKAGFDRPPRTFEEFEEMAYAIAALGTDEEGNKIWGTNIAGLTDLHVPFLISPWLYNFGGRWFDDNGKSAINSREAIELLTFFKKMYDDGVFGPVPIDRETNRTLFVEGDLGFIGEGPWQRGIWRQTSGMGEAYDDTWWVDTYPTRDGKPGKSIMWASSAAIMKAAEHKEEAAKVIEMWVADPDVVLAYNEMHGGIPSVKSIQNLPQIQENAYVKVFVDAIQAGGTLPFHPYATKINEFSTGFAKAFHDILINDAPIKKTADKLAADMDRIAAED
jgi:ABC-type glycerol-3-phosphate transport system substrate-binding protein